MSFFDLSDVDWSALWFPPAFIVFFGCLIFRLYRPSGGLRRRAFQIGLIVGLGQFAFDVVDRYPVDGRQVRHCLWNAILAVAMTTIFIWMAKPTLLMHWQDCKALVARIRRWRRRRRPSSEQISPITIAESKLAEPLNVANPTSIPPRSNS